jgi:dehydrogenase/reductase SDR family member 12
VIATAIDRAFEFLVVPSFTRLGCAVRRRAARWQPLESYDLTGRTALVTGGTSGIGLAVAELLARMGATVALLGRDAGRLDMARTRVQAASGDRPVLTVQATMDNATSIRDAAVEVRAAMPRLDVLVHNAGALALAYRRSPMGIEVTVAAQVAGPFLLTGLLLDRLTQASGRVITVTSGGAYLVPLSVSGLDPAPAEFDGARQYSRAKRAQITLNELWAERAGASGVAFHAMHPGWVDTPGLATSLPRFRRLIGPLLRSPAEGADTIAWLAAEDPAGLGSGRLWHDRVVRPAHRIPRTRRVETAEQRAGLWAWCEQHAGWSLDLDARKGGA